MTVTFFPSALDFRHWLEANHQTTTEIWVGFYRKDAGQAGITYVEALDEALCFGWIDGIRKKVDALRYTNRFTPRKPRSTWSRVNIRRLEELSRLGRVTPAGAAAYAARDPERSGIYSFEQRPQSLPPELERQFRAKGKAWSFFQAQPPGYRRTVIWWVISAKKPETRDLRLKKLIAASTKETRLA
ncbi:MAG: YdeI/OmpD-associated family protein [Verrucomicrobiales bacterium]|nr:YdeI/OmpD-associated family protein [Verrucomicrobiales bacterium]